MKYLNLIRIGNKALDCGQKDIANIAVAVLLHHFEHDPADQSDISRAKAAGLWIEYETRDIAGYHPGQVYYDVVWIRAVDEERQFAIEEIPVPAAILQPFELAANLKRARSRFRDHEPRTREQVEPSAAAISSLWEGLKKELTRDQAFIAVNCIFNEEDNGNNPLRKYLSDLIDAHWK